jgi:TM2 domain-containing membrane protein YozV
MGMATDKANSAPLPYVALVLACIIPGAGHAYIGRLKRGIIIFVTITGLFWTGVGVGGVLTVDCYQERWWFIAEMLTGVNGLVGWVRQHNQYEQLLADVPGQDIQEKLQGLRGVYREGQAEAEARLDKKMVDAGVALVPPAETVARAYAGAAGLLNLMCIFDALLLSIMGAGAEPRRPQEQAENRSAAAADADKSRAKES